MNASMMKRLKELEDENRHLKKMHAEERLKAEIYQEALDNEGRRQPQQFCIMVSAFILPARSWS
jgi:hypothetical protein